MVAAVVMRTFVLATMLASASSFAPAPKTQLAMRRPPPTPPRVMPPVMIPHGPLHCVGFPGFPSQASKNWEIAMVCLVPTPHGPACTSPLDSRAPEATALAPARLPGAPRLWSPSPLEPAPAMCAVTNTTNSQLHRFRACAGEGTARARAILVRLHAHRLCVYHLCTRNRVLSFTHIKRLGTTTFYGECHNAPPRSSRPTPPATPASNGFESIPTEGL